MRLPLLAFVPRTFLAASLVLVPAPLTSQPLLAQREKSQYSSPELLTAADINYPINSAGSGVVEVAIYLDSGGSIKGTDTLRDIPSLTSSVLLSIPKWTFKPAMLGAQPVDSTIVASIAFNPGNYLLGGAGTPALGKPLDVLSPDASGFQPPAVLTASWASYPINSVAQGAVVLDARIGRDGHVTAVAAVWNNPSLTKISIAAAKRWTFTPASFGGRAVAARAVIGYVFRPPNIASPVAQP